MKEFILKISDGILSGSQRKAWMQTSKSK